MSEVGTRVGIVSRTATYWPLYLLERDGLIELVELGSTAAGVDELLAGRVAAAATCPDALIAAGAPLRVAAGLVDRPPAWLVGAPSIAVVTDLRGRRVATTAAEGSVSIFLRALLRESGLPRGAYEEVAVGTTPAQAEALAAGRVDAAMLTLPFDESCVARGFRRLAYVGDALGPAAFTTVNVRRGWTASAAWPPLREAIGGAIGRLRSPGAGAKELAVLADATGVDVASAPRIDYDVGIPFAGLDRLLGFLRLEGATTDGTARDHAEGAPASGGEGA